MSEKFISSEEAAQILGVSDRTIRRWANDGKVISRRDGRVFEIQYASVQALATVTQEETREEITVEENKGDAVSDTRDCAESTDIEGDIPSDIFELAKELVEATDTLNSVADKVLKRLWFEHKRNEVLEEDLADALAKVRLPPPRKFEHRASS